MNKRRMAWILGTAAALLALSLVGVRANALVKGRPTAIAVVDLQQVFAGLAEKRQIDADVQDKNQKLLKEQDDRKNKIKELQADIEILVAGSDARNKKEEELEQKAVELQAWGAFQNQKLNRERGMLVESIYRKITDALGRTAQENGYDLVLFKEPAPDFRNAKEPAQLSAMIEIRKVLWSAPDMDLTQQVIDKMNNEYKNKGGTMPPATAPARNPK